MVIDHNSPIPRYYQLKNILADRIKDLEPGQKFFSMREISDMYGLSLLTVRQSLKELSNEGRIALIRGRGTFVTDPSIVRREKKEVVNHTLAAIVPDFNYFLPPIIKSFSEAIHEAGYEMLVYTTDNRSEKERKYLQMLAEQKKVKGVLICPARDGDNDNLYTQLHQNHFPFVMLGRTSHGLQINSVIDDDIAGSYEVVNHLIGLGHKRIGCIGTMVVDSIAEHERIEGYRKALRDSYLDIDERLIKRRDSFRDEDDFDRSIKELLLDDEIRPTAIFALNDMIAAKVLNNIIECEFSVPQDIALAGYDDSEIALALSVPLTTVAQPKHEMGVKAAELLLNQIQGKDEKVQQIVLKPHLVVRESSGAVQ